MVVNTAVSFAGGGGCGHLPLYFLHLSAKMGVLILLRQIWDEITGPCSGAVLFQVTSKHDVTRFALGIKRD